MRELTVVEAAAAIKGGELSAVELTEAVLAQVDRLNPALNAYLNVDGDGALAQARAAVDGPLAGIPICVKDVIDVAGMATCAGAASWRRRPERDAGAVARLRAAGAVIVGKDGTNVKFRMKCTACGHEDSSWKTMRITRGTTRSSFYCPKCRKRRDAEIHGTL